MGNMSGNSIAETVALVGFIEVRPLLELATWQEMVFSKQPCF